jgi:hypothetical protein
MGAGLVDVLTAVVAGVASVVAAFVEVSSAKILLVINKLANDTLKISLRFIYISSDKSLDNNAPVK